MRKITKNIPWRKLDLFLFLAILGQLVFIGQTLASSEDISHLVNLAQPTIDEVAYKKKIIVTAYSSTPDQTDSTPCIAARGFNLCKHNEENILAANFLPMGTKIKIPEYFGDKIFIVQDRMNARYFYRADLWMKNREKAIQWGARYAEVEVLK